jgi:hypothetical protein
LSGGTLGPGLPGGPAVRGAVQLIHLSSLAKIEEAFKTAAAQ